jgi:nucleoside-triphosphatase
MNLLLTGRPGVGKTTIVAAVARQLADRRLGGFITEELREAGQRIGFALRPFGGTPRTMAHRSFVSPHRVGRYGVDVEIIDYVVDTTLSPRAPVELFLVDEIGKMECLSRRFVGAIPALLDDERPVVTTIAASGGGLIAEVKARADVETWEITAANRDEAPARVLEWLGRLPADGAPGTVDSPPIR